MTDPDGTSRRKRRERRAPYAAAAGENPLDSLSPSGKRILEAARRVVAAGGIGALSMQAVADEAGELKSTVAYQFGDKAGLISALLDSVIHDRDVMAAEVLDRLPTGSQRVHYLLRHQREVAATGEYWRLLFALVPEIAKDDRLRERYGELFRSYQRLDLMAIGIGPDEEPTPEAQCFASLLLAVVEGFALQRELTPEGFDLDARFALWESIITPYIESLGSGQAGLRSGRPGSRHGEASER